MSRRQTIRRIVALLLRLTAIAFLLAIAVGIAGAYAIGLTRPYLQIFGQNVVGETSAYYTIQENELILSCSKGWNGTHSQPGALCSAPGLSIDRTIVTLTAQARGDEQLTIRVRWWLLAIPCGLSLLAGFILFRPLLRRRFSGPGRCPNCGYDLRATPERCPECGTARVAGSRMVK
jgi:hypothetical protein